MNQLPNLRIMLWAVELWHLIKPCNHIPHIRHVFLLVLQQPRYNLIQDRTPIPWQCTVYLGHHAKLFRVWRGRLESENELRAVCARLLGRTSDELVAAQLGVEAAE